MEKSVTRQKIWRLFKRREVFTLALLIAVLVVSMSLSSSFRDIGYILKSATRYVEYGMIALSMTMIVIAGMIDLSVPAIMVCLNTFVAMMYTAGMPLGWAIGMGVLIGMALGAFNGVLIAYLKLPALIVTIGTLNAYRGLSQIFIGDKSLGSFPEWFNSIEKVPIFKGENFTFGVTLLLFIIFAVIFYFVLHRTRFGRSVYAIGFNERAAIYSGIKTKHIKFILFVISGFICSIAGMLTMSRLLLVRWDMATGGELEIVTMVLLGGTEITGGRGSVIGTFLAVIIIIILKTGLLVANVTANAQMFIMGMLLLTSIIIPNIMNYYREKKG